MTTMAEPRGGKVHQRLVDGRRGPRVNSPRRLADRTRTSGFCMISRPMMNFCRLPPDSNSATAEGPVALTEKVLITVSASAARPWKRSCPGGPCFAVARGQDGVVGRENSGTAA